MTITLTNTLLKTDAKRAFFTHKRRLFVCFSPRFIIAYDFLQRSLKALNY